MDKDPRRQETVGAPAETPAERRRRNQAAGRAARAARRDWNRAMGRPSWDNGRRGR